MIFACIKFDYFKLSPQNKEMLGKIHHLSDSTFRSKCYKKNKLTILILNELYTHTHTYRFFIVPFLNVIH